MTGSGCSRTKKGKRRKHTPIVSQKQRALFYSVAEGKSTKATGLSVTEAKRHLAEARHKHLPTKA